MAVNESANLYMSIFGRMVYKKYTREKEPMNFVLFPRPVSGVPLFTDDEMDENYQRCIRENKPWQEIPDIAERVKAWHREYDRGIDKGEIY